ncbi:MAG: L-2-amino-thiazoline-4-carboxylic acid hydrolase [Synergistaceae bacterium]|nr:L-2-amino-thiazoline-4-carboxylic acid hydrolase [Synergistaceae bacterium]
MANLGESLGHAADEGALQQFADFSAALYYFMAKTMIDRFGEEGREAVKEAVHAFGVYRGRRVRRRVLQAGEKPLMENEYKHHDLPIGTKIWEAESEHEGGRQTTKVLKCPFGRMWQAMEKKEACESATEIGRLYCDVDYAIWEGYNGRIGFELQKCIFEGDEYCQMSYDLSREVEG